MRQEKICCIKVTEITHNSRMKFMIYEYVLNHQYYGKSMDCLVEFLKKLDLTNDAILIKVNWSSDKSGYFTDGQTLQFLINGLMKAYDKAEIVIIEAYSYGRNDPDLEHHQGEEMLRKDIIRANEEHFLEEQGFNKIFQETNCEYINVTEEFWNGRVVDQALVERHISEKYQYIVNNPELLKTVPLSLYKYRGKSLLDFAKIKGIVLPGFLFFTLSQKNLFGLIPNTCRRHYHGKPKLVNAIIDMNVIYKSIFDVVGFCEALFNTLFISDKEYVIKNSGCMVASRDLVTLDAAVIKSLSFNPYDRNFIRMTERQFGDVNKEHWNVPILTEIFLPLLKKSINIEEIKNSKEKVEFVI